MSAIESPSPHEIYMNHLRSLQTTRVILYIVKRAFVAADEWLFYAVLIYLYQRKFPLWITMTAAVYGTLATVTHYKNLEIIERQLGICGHLLWTPWSAHILADIPRATSWCLENVHDTAARLPLD
jgi:hypothetical protein